MIIKKLSKVGNSCALFIDKPYLDLLNADVGTEFEMTIVDKNIVFSPVSADKREAAIKRAAADFKKSYPKTLKKLAE